MANDGDSESKLGAVLGLGFWVALGLLYAWTSSEAVQTFMKDWWWIIAIVLGLSASAVFVPGIWRRLPAFVQIAVVVFGLIPAVLTGMAVALQRQPELVLRIVFLTGVCLLPATLYYLFSVTRKATLVHSFVNNLERLGLLDPAGAAPERENRVYAYAEKFKAIYGPVRPEVLKDQFPPYAENLQRALSQQSPGQISSKFAEIFPSDVAIPILLATMLTALGWFIALPPDPRSLEHFLPELLGPLAPENNPVNFAFLGAYFFSVQMLFRRYVRLDLRGSAYVSIALRIVIAVIGIWAAAAAWTLDPDRVVAREPLLVLGFSIGIFPPIVWQVVSGVVKRYVTGFLFPPLQTQLPLHELDGLTVWHQERLVEEDIENIPNMATADIVELTLRTTMPPDRIVDWVDQAILYTNLGAKKGKNEEDPRTQLRLHGIRTASDLVTVHQVRGRQDGFVNILSTGGKGPSRLASLVEAVHTNPNLDLILHWRGLKPGGAHGQAGGRLTQSPADRSMSRRTSRAGRHGDQRGTRIESKREEVTANSAHNGKRVNP